MSEKAVFFTDMDEYDAAALRHVVVPNLKLARTGAAYLLYLALPKGSPFVALRQTVTIAAVDTGPTVDRVWYMTPSSDRAALAEVNGDGFVLMPANIRQANPATWQETVGHFAELYEGSSLPLSKSA